MNAILELRDVSKAFGAVVIADALNLSVAQGEGLGIIGPNGAGKSTLFNLITGDQQVNAGKILLNGKEVTQTKAHNRCRAGVGRSYQIPHPFGAMTVYENVLTARLFGAGESERAAAHRTMEILSLTGLAPFADAAAGSLTLLRRKRLELARALATDPRILLLDEIAGGLTEGEVHELIDTIRSVRETGVSIVWIEHVVHALLATVDRLIVLNGGDIIAEGVPENVMRSDDVRRIYMGLEPADAA